MQGLMLALSLAAAPSPATACPQRVVAAGSAVLDTIAALQHVPGAFPAYAVVAVCGDTTPLAVAHGRTRADRSTPVSTDTRFYLASQTKSFMALLAADLDADDTLPLSTTLADVWPSLHLSAPADPTRITMADLLSHQDGLQTDTLNFLTAYVRTVPASDYPAMLAAYTVAREPGFRYSNLGDLIYGAALEARTGRSWHDWLDERVLVPLRLDQATTRPSRIAAETLAWGHRWDGHAWIPLAPKPDTLMHAAGGLFASTDDLARWMRANLQRKSPGGRPSAAAFALAQQARAAATLSDGEFACDGYSLGWYTCHYAGEDVLMHPGGYPGVVSATVLLPDQQAGLSLVVTSDSAMEYVELELIKAFIGAAGGRVEDARLQALRSNYPAKLGKTVAKRADAVAKARADGAWEGWRWQPTLSELDEYTGEFSSSRLGRLQVRREGKGLVALLGELTMPLEPARPGMFGATRLPLDPPEPFEFVDDRQGLRWNDEDFRRVPAGSP